eukprot:RCo033141
MKSMIITGASSGIGKGLAHELAKRGFDLGLTARRTSSLEQLKRELEFHHNVKVHIAPLDVREVAQVGPTMEELSRKLNGVGTIVANSGITGVRPLGKGKFNMDLDIIQTNLIGGMATVEAAAKIFRELGRGHIVGISSFMAFRGIAGTGAYSASKAGFTNYLTSAQVELAPKGITVGVLYVGFVKTELMDNMEKYPFLAPLEKVAPQIADAIEQRVPSAILPPYPWKLIRPLVNCIPDNIWRKMF